LKTTFRASFGRDLKRIKDERVLGDVRTAIIETEAAAVWKEIPNIKKIKGASNAFRVRVGDYRIGIYIEHDSVEFVRVLSRRDIYKKFP
jgi:mRNA interferase RelE/StbE